MFIDYCDSSFTAFIFLDMTVDNLETIKTIGLWKCVLGKLNSHENEL